MNPKTARDKTIVANHPFVIQLTGPPTREGSLMGPGADSTTKPLFPRFSEAEYQRRRRAILDAMAKEGLDATIVAGMGAPEVPSLQVPDLRLTG